MKRALTFILLALLSKLSWSQTEIELVKKVRAKLDKVQDYQASGTMKIDISFIKAPKSGVKVFYKKPDLFRVKKDGGISILPKGGVSINMNTLTATDNFTAIPAGTIMLNNIPVKVIKMLPGDENSDIVLTTLYLDEKNLVIRKSRITTRENGTFEMDMTYGKYMEWGLPDQVTLTFNTRDYKLPKGVTFEYDNGEKRDKEEMLKNKKGTIVIDYSQYIINKGIDDSVFK